MKGKSTGKKNENAHLHIQTNKVQSRELTTHSPVMTSSPPLSYFFFLFHFNYTALVQLFGEVHRFSATLCKCSSKEDRVQRSVSSSGVSGVAL